MLLGASKCYVLVENVTSDGVNAEFVEHSLSLIHGGTYWAILLVVLVAGSLLIFRRRDVL